MGSEAEWGGLEYGLDLHTVRGVIDDGAMPTIGEFARLRIAHTLEDAGGDSHSGEFVVDPSVLLRSVLSGVEVGQSSGQAVVPRVG